MLRDLRGSFSLVERPLAATMRGGRNGVVQLSYG
jgi:hypothetical protein